MEKTGVKVCEKCSQSVIEYITVNNQEHKLCERCLKVKLQGENLIEKIQKYCDENPVILDFDYRESLSDHSIKSILNQGLDDWIMEMDEYNLEYIWENEDYFKKETLIPKFKEEIIEFISFRDSCEKEEIDDNEIFDFLSNVYVDCYLDYQKLLDYTNITAYFTVYSSYDCTVSFHTIDDKENYLYQVYKYFKAGIKKADYLKEHSEVYGGSLLIFPFEISLSDFFKLKEEMKTAKTLTIPKGTNFGFYSSFVGSASPLEQETYRKMTIPIAYGENPDYDCIGLDADLIHSYSLQDVSGGIDFDEVDFQLN